MAATQRLLNSKMGGRADGDEVWLWVGGDQNREGGGLSSDRRGIPRMPAQFVSGDSRDTQTFQHHTGDLGRV